MPLARAPVRNQFLSLEQGFELAKKNHPPVDSLLGNDGGWQNAVFLLWAGNPFGLIIAFG